MDFEKPPLIIVALDLPPAEAAKLVKALEPAEGRIAAYKIGSINALEIGVKETVAELRQFTKLPIIYDHQKGCTDIPEIVARQVEIVAEGGADSFIAVPLGAGGKSLELFVDACKRKKIVPIALLEMTHPGANDFLAENAARKVFEKAVALGVEYFVAPATEPEKIREYKDWGESIKIMSPGIGAQGGSAREAVAAGTDYPIVGRQISQAENPAGEVEKIYKECLEGFKKRK